MRKFTILTIFILLYSLLKSQIQPQSSPYYNYGMYTVISDSDMTTNPTVLTYRPSINTNGPFPVLLFQLGANGFGSSAINAHSYDIFLKHLASYGYVVIIVNDPNPGFPTGTSFSTIYNWFKSKTRNTSHWLSQYADTLKVAVAGHSNGGVNATGFLLNHPNEINAIIYFASYPSSPFPNHDVSNYSGYVLDLAGTEDNTSTPTNCKNGFNKYTSSPCRVWALISGLNHGGFGDYINSSQPVGSIGRNDATATIRHYLISFLEAKLKNNTIAANQLFSSINRPNTTNEFITNCTLPTLIDSENITTSNLSVKPNPANNIVKIENSNSNHKIAILQLFDISGKLLMDLNNQNISNEINLEKFGQGIYIIQITLDNGAKKNIKIIKQ